MEDETILSWQFAEESRGTGDPESSTAPRWPLGRGSGRPARHLERGAPGQIRGLRGAILCRPQALPFRRGRARRRGRDHRHHLPLGRERRVFTVG